MLIKNGYLIDPASGRAEFADLQISDGKIFSDIGQHLSVPVMKRSLMLQD